MIGRLCPDWGAYNLTEKVRLAGSFSNLVNRTDLKYSILVCKNETETSNDCQPKEEILLFLHNVMFDFRIRYRDIHTTSYSEMKKFTSPLIIREKLIATFQITPTTYLNIKNFM